MKQNNIEDNVNAQGSLFESKLSSLKNEYPFLINTVRGKGLLWAIEFRKKEYATFLFEKALEKGLLLNLKHGVIIRLFPALIITTEEVNTAFDIISGIVKEMAVECVDL
jgi:acetylornithine/succinyldiaminopimelate/putrescine aminotransferase